MMTFYALTKCHGLNMSLKPWGSSYKNVHYTLHTKYLNIFCKNISLFYMLPFSYFYLMKEKKPLRTQVK